MPGIEDYLSGLWQAVQGNAQQPAGPTPSSTPASSSTPQPGGFMQDVSSVLGNPLTQAALSGYLSAIGSPRRAGVGGAISAGGLAGLNAYNSGENAQQQQVARARQAQIDAAKAQEEQTQFNQQQKAFTGLNPGEQARALYPSIGTYEDKAAIELNNKNSVAAFQAGHQGDPKAALFSAPYAGMQTAVTPGDIEKDYQEQLQAPAKAQELQASIDEKKAQATRLKNAPAAGTEANWYDPATKQYYRGAQKKPTDIPASVAQSSKSEQEMKARATAWQKAHDQAATEYVKLHPGHLGFGGATTEDTEAYARAQADAQVNALFGTTGTAAGAPTSSADEPSSTEDPLSLIPEGATPGTEGGVHGYRTADGQFHSVE